MKNQSLNTIQSIIMDKLLYYKSELLKIRGTSAPYLAALLALFVPAIICLDYTWTENVIDNIGANPWLGYVSDSFELINLSSLPFMIILMCSTLAQLEYRGNCWKQVLVTPQSKFEIWFTKLFVVLIFVGLFLICSCGFILIVPYFIDGWTNTYKFYDHSIPFYFVLELAAKSFACCLGLITIQFWLSIRFGNLVVPIAGGMVIWFSGSILTSYSGDIAWDKWHPYLLPAQASDSLNWFDCVLRSVWFSLVFFYLGFLNFSRREIKT